jgi:hypothetical protein
MKDGEEMTITKNIQFNGKDSEDVWYVFQLDDTTGESFDFRLDEEQMGKLYELMGRVIQAK